MNNWKELGTPFQDFNEESTQRWIENGLTHEQAKEWFKFRFDFTHSYFIAWLRGEKKITISDWKDFNTDQINELINQFKEFYQDFDYCSHCWKLIRGECFYLDDLEKEEGFCSENCQVKWTENKELLEWQRIRSWSSVSSNEIKAWKKLNFTLETAKQWGKLGFSYEKAAKWRDHFGLKEAEYWIKELELEEDNFNHAYYWKNNGIRPSNKKELKQIKEAGFSASAQKWIDTFYPQDSVCLFNDNCSNQGKRRDQITDLNLTWLKLIGKLDLSDFTNLEKLNCAHNQLSSLELNDCLKLRELNAANNQLTEIILPIKNKLKEIVLDDNLLIKFDYQHLNPKTLTILNLANNNLEITNIAVFLHLINLEELSIGSDKKEKIKKDIYNRFSGSLASLQNCTKLEKLSISKTDIKQGLEYLSTTTSLKRFFCLNTKLGEQLSIYRNDLFAWQVAHSNLMKAAGREMIELDYAKIQLIITITIPKFLEERISENIELKSNDELTNLDYDNFILRDDRPFSWEVKKPLEYNSRESNKFPEIDISEENNISFESKLSGERQSVSTIQQQLPLRLYNLLTNRVENAYTYNNNINNYLAMSYCWGTEWEKTPQTYGQAYLTDLTKLGRKALNKVKAFYHCFDHVDHIWIDNFCINQSDNLEKGQEVKQQKQYYSQATATLIAIDAEIGTGIDKDDEVAMAYHLLRLIIKSDWFTRAWTFQEGILSKQTIFMFDDYLVDGRLLSQYWGGIRFNRGWIEGAGIWIKPNPIVNITPLGWSYGVQTYHSFDLTLGEALLAVSHRSQTVSIDGIYAILGLLPYGSKVPINYKDKLCQKCKTVEQKKLKTIICPHSIEEKTEYPNYFKEELENALAEVIKVACQNGYQIDPFSWYGSRSNQLIPIINQNGTTNVGESIDNWELKELKQRIISIDESVVHLKDVKLEVVKGVEGKWINLEWERIFLSDSNVAKFMEVADAGDVLIIFKFKVEEMSFFLFMPTNPQHSIYFFQALSNFSYSDYSEILINLKKRTIIEGEEAITAYQAIQLQFDQCFKSVEKKLINWRSSSSEESELRINTLKQFLTKVTIEQTERQSNEWKELKKALKRNGYINYHYDLTKISQLQLQLNRLTENNESSFEINVIYEGIL